MASRKVKKPKKRAQRATSNVFAMFAQDQIQVKYHMLSLKICQLEIEIHVKSFNFELACF